MFILTTRLIRPGHERMADQDESTTVMLLNTEHIIAALPDGDLRHGRTIIWLSHDDPIVIALPFKALTAKLVEPAEWASWPQ